MTRSKVRGSIAIPEAVLSGKSGGLDMIVGDKVLRVLLTLLLLFDLRLPPKLSSHRCSDTFVLLTAMRYAVLVTGPAGAGKSTFCSSLMTHLQASRRTAHLVNLDPAAAPDSFEYAPTIDIKDLVSVEDVMSEFGYGPNGGLVYCFEYVSTSSSAP